VTGSLGRSGILPRSAFEDPGVYDTEQRVVGERCWALLGPAEWVAADGAWMTGRVGNREVFVQRFGERLVGFENVCSHRFSQIRASRRGIGALQCPYHGWTFNAQGVPVGIPHCRELFGVAPHQLADRRLRPIELAAVGQMIFGRLPGTGPDDRPDVALGRWFALFAALDRRSLELFSEHEQTMRANWKLGFQNTLDEYHITAVHPKSFGSGGWLQPGQFRYQEDGAHDAMVLKRAGLGDIDADSVVRAVADGTPLPVDYAIYHFFPDFLVGFVAGRVVMVTRYEAMDVGETRVRTYLFDMLPPGGVALTAQKRSAMAKYVGTVLEEDREAVERWSKGLRQAWAAPLHGLQEQRLSHFEQSWASLVPAGAGSAEPQS
jgi:phenylpropionate dioxygenase-like ring-hydroxylating dioxygenase large terminal subunit